MAGILTYIAALLCVITVSEACKCAVIHPQTSFCIADFAIKAKVLNQTVDNSTRFGSRIFKLRIRKIFKGEAQINGTIAGEEKGGKRVVRAYTPRQTPACGIRLKTSKVYLLLGNIRDNKLRLDSCQWYQQWKDTTGKQRLGVREHYGQNCACLINCLAPRSQCDKMIKGCDVPDSQWKVTDCKKKYAYCKKNKSGDACRWVKKKRAFEKCSSKN